MTQTATQATARDLAFGARIEFTNNWGQQNQRAAVLWQDGDTLGVDYLGCQHEISTAAVTKVL